MKYTFYFLLSLSFWAGCANENTTIELDKSYQGSLTENGQNATYIFLITEDKIPAENKWFFFIDVEPTQEKEWTTTKIEIFLRDASTNKSRAVKNCSANKGGLDSCMLTNFEFDYKVTQVIAFITCQEQSSGCQFTISAEISVPLRMQVNQVVKMDFQDTAYSKLFILDASKDNFDQLQLILKPQGFLVVAAPIGMYLNFGEKIPTQSDCDRVGIALWDDGQGIFLNRSQGQKLMTILIQGPEKNILIFSIKGITEVQGVKLEQEYIFDYLEADRKRNYFMTIDYHLTNCIKIGTFSGSVYLSGVTAQKTVIHYEDMFIENVYAYGELEYCFSPQLFKDISKNSDDLKLTIAISAKKKSAFLVQRYIKDNDVTVLLPQINKFMQIKSNQYQQFFIKLSQVADSNFKTASLQIIIKSTTIKYLELRFFACRRTPASNCFLTKNQTTIMNDTIDNMKRITNFGEKFSDDSTLTFLFNIKKDDFHSVQNSTINTFTLSLMVKNTREGQCSFSVQYINIGKNIYLKQNIMREDRVYINESKYYTFIVEDIDVETVHIHLSQIAGKASLQGFNKDPRTNSSILPSAQFFYQALSFKQVLQNTSYYVKVTGLDRAYYSLTMQYVRKSEKNSNDHSGKGYNEISLYEGIRYNFIIPKHEKQAFKMFVKKDIFTLLIRSLLPVTICMTEKMKNPPYAPNCQIKGVVMRSFVEDIKMDQGLVSTMGVLNGNEKDVNFQIFFTSEKSNLCFRLSMGKVHTLELPTKKVCFNSFLTSVDQDVEVIIELASKDYNKSFIEISIQETETIVVTKTMNIISKDVLRKICGEQLCRIKIDIQLQEVSKIQVLVQRMGQAIVLVDGIANRFHGTEISRKFIYQFINKINTTVVLQNIEGSFSFYGKIVPASNSYDGIIANEKDHSFQSQNPYYSTFLTATISDQDIIKANCIKCALIISVINNNPVIKQSKFSIECTQQIRFLKQNIEMPGLLTQGSTAFYQYTNDFNGSIILRVNTHFKNCVDVYGKKNNSSPATASNNEVEGQNSIFMIPNAVAGPYTFSLKAREHCLYSLQVMTSKNKKFVSLLTKGSSKDVNLSPNQSMYFMYQNKGEAFIKFLALRQTGEVKISAIAYPYYHELLNTDLDGIIKYQFVELNLLIIASIDKNYCENCFYLIQLVSQLGANLFFAIGAQERGFLISTGNSMKDQLAINDTEIFEVNGDYLKEYQIIVLHGKVNVTVYCEKQKKQQSTKIYEANEKGASYKFSTSQIKNGSFFPFSDYNMKKVTVTALQKTIFVISFINDKDQQERKGSIILGVPVGVYLKQNQLHCFKGTLDDQNQQFLLSSSSTSQSDILGIQKSTVTFQVDGKKVKLQNSTAKNDIFYKLNESVTALPAKYKFCLKAGIQTYIMFTQTSEINYFFEGTSVLVIKQINLTFNANGKVILQVNDCKSRALATVSSSFGALASMKSEIAQVSRANNLVTFDYYGLVFVHVTAVSAVVSWRQVKDRDGAGIGYDEFISGKIRIFVNDQNLNLTVYPLKRAKQNKAYSVLNVTYRIFMGKEESELYNGMNCNQGTFLNDSRIKKGQITEDTIIFLFEIEKIKAFFVNENFFLVGVLAEGYFLNKNNEEQKYRFLFPYQEVTMNALNNKKQAAANETSSISYVSIISLILIIGFIAVVVYQKYLKRYFKQKRNKLTESTASQIKYHQFTAEK